MNRFLFSFLAISLAIFCIGALRFFYPELFSENLIPFVQNIISSDKDTVPSEDLKNGEVENKDIQDYLSDTIAEKTPEDEHALFERAQKFFLHNALLFAERDLLVLIEKNSEYKEARLLLIKLYIRKRDFETAEKIAKESLQLFPNDQKFLVPLGDLFLQQGHIEEAKTTFSALLETAAERNFFLGIIALVEKNYTEGKLLLEAASENEIFRTRSNLLLAAFKEYDLFPDGSPLHLETLLAKVLNDIEFFELSLLLSKNVLLENTEYRDAWLINGYSHLSMGKYEFAQNAFQRAFEIDPVNPVTAYYVGITLKRLQDFDTALNFFQRAQKNGFSPESEILREMADTYYLQENYTLSLETLEQSLTLSVQDVSEFIRPIHVALNFLKNPELGIKFGNSAVEKYPDVAMAYNLRGWAYLENNDLVSAENDLQTALQKDNQLSAAYLNLGKLREVQKRWEEALDLYEKVYELDPFSDIGRSAVQRYNALVDLS